MDTGLYEGAAAMSALTRVQDTLAFNLAHTSTVGFKRRVAALGEFQKQLQVATGPAMPMPRPYETLDFSSGSLAPTGNPLDLAIEGPSFFKVETPGGIRYTRGGTFARGIDGSLVNGAGDRLVIDGSLDPRKPVTFDPDGNVFQDADRVGRIPMVDIADVRRLVPEGNFRYRGAPSLERAGTSHLRSGHLEQSNTSPVESLVALITVQRAFESATRAVHTIDEALQKTTNPS